MPNRAERRAQAKQNRRGVPQQYDQTHGRARSGMLDEYQLQEKSRRLQEGTDGPWKPTAAASDVAHRHGFRGLRGRCDQPVLHCGQSAAQSEP